MNLLIRVLIILLIVIVSDFYYYQTLKNSFFHNTKHQLILKYIIIILCICFIIFELSVYFIIGFPEDSYIKYRQLFLILDAFILIYLPKAVIAFFLIISDLIKLIIKLSKYILRKKSKIVIPKWIYITAFISYFVIEGIAVYGFVYGKTNLKVERVEIFSSKLPKSFDGFTIVQISDLHLGSFLNTKTIEESVDIVNKINPDIIVFTGDLINVSDKEIKPFINILSKLRSTYGKFSILGNHDIGDYFTLKKPINQSDITRKLIIDEKEMGFIILIDSSCYIKKGSDSIGLIGVNNCGFYPFKHSGNLPKAMKNVKDTDFKVLLSHDPNHWRAEVIEKTDIDVTLSGHTHAMQMAVICKLFKISPAMFKYHEWYGLYNSGEQQLYVNPGMSYSGFSGRIGTRPEITLITLKTKK